MKGIAKAYVEATKKAFCLDMAVSPLPKALRLSCSKTVRQLTG
jgi:hypothetical protein